jgi:MFS transporter, ACS family, glucarate transporter
MNRDLKNNAIVGLLCATATAGYICRVNVSTAGALMMKDLGLDQPAMGRVFSAFLLGYALCQIPGGAAADRWGARRTLRVLAWIWAALTIALAFVGWGPFAAVLPASGALIALRFLLGVSAAPTYPSSAQGVSRWVEVARQGRANGIVIASVGIGSALASPLVSSVMIRWNWRVALAVSAVPSIAAALVWLRIREPRSVVTAGRATAAKTPSPGPASRTGGFMNRNFLFLTLSYSLQGYVGYIFVSWFYLYLVQERGFGMLAGAWVNSLSWLLSIVSIPLGGMISDRLTAGRFGAVWGRRIVPVVGMSASGILISIGAHTRNPAVAAAALALATAAVLSVEGPFWAMMMRIAGPSSGTAGGIMNTGCNIGGLISPALTPVLATWFGWENALHLAAALAIVAAALWLGIDDRSHRAMGQQSAA